jgi:hypothetical protein
MSRKNVKSGPDLQLDKTENESPTEASAGFYEALGRQLLLEQINSSLKAVEAELQKKLRPKPYGKLMAIQDRLITCEEFSKIESDISSQIDELISAKCNINKLVETWLEQFKRQEKALKNAVIEWSINPNEATKLAKDKSIDERLEIINSIPFMVELHFLSHRVVQIMGESCAGDIAKLMTTFTIEKRAAGIVARDQAHSLLNIMGAIRTDPKSKFQEREAIFYRFYLTCWNIIFVIPSKDLFRNQPIQKKTQGGNQIERIRRFCEKKDTKVFLKQLATSGRSYGECNLSDEQLVVASSFGFKDLAFMLGSVSEASDRSARKGTDFQLQSEISTARRELGAKLQANEPSIRAFTFLPAMPRHRRLIEQKHKMHRTRD